MKIVVIARTRNESKNIERFCSAYQWADRILIADGKSEDDTVSLAQKFPNVSVRPFWHTIIMDNGIVRTPHGEHLNFLIDWAIDAGADWVIQDDVDCFPNYFLKRDGRTLIHCAQDFNQVAVYVTRLYLYKDRGHFPKMAQPKKAGQWLQGLWAWDVHSPLRFKEGIHPSEHQQLVWSPSDNVLLAEPPYCLLHCPWQDEEMIQRKLEFYRKSGEVPNMRHPMDMGLSVEPLPEWAREDE